MTKTLKKDLITIIVMIVPLIISEGVVELLGIPDKVVYILKLVDFVIILGMFFLKEMKFSKQIKFSNQMKWITLIYGTIFVSALFHGAFKITLFHVISSYAMCLLFELWLKKRKVLFLEVTTIMLCSMVVINFISVLLFPKGMYETRLYTNNWILGYKNSHFSYIMASIAFLNVLSFSKQQKLTKVGIVYMLMCCLSLYLVDSMTAFVCMALYTFVVVCFVNNKNNKYISYILKIFNVRFCIIAIAVIGMIIIIGSTSQSFVTDILNKILGVIGRNASFTGRDRIWKVTIDLIKKSPILGYGVINSGEYAQMTGMSAGTHAHNYIFNILIMGGGVCLIEHIVLYYNTIKMIMKKNNEIAISLGYIIVIYFLSGITAINFYEILFNPLFILVPYALNDKMYKTKCINIKFVKVIKPKLRVINRRNLK